MSMTYEAFFQQIRDKTKDTLDAANPKVLSVLLGRHTLGGCRELMSKFPETRLDDQGRLAELPTVGYTESTASAAPKPVLPIPPEFEPALEAYVLRGIYGSDAEDVKDESLFRFWDRKYKELIGEA